MCRISSQKIGTSVKIPVFKFIFSNKYIDFVLSYPSWYFLATSTAMFLLQSLWGIGVVVLVLQQYLRLSNLSLSFVLSFVQKHIP